MSNSRPYVGKDGNHYSDYYTKVAADNRYEQEERLIEEQKEANRLAKEQNERIKNGGYTDSEILMNSINNAILSRISKKNYCSEISNGLALFIIPLYIVAIIGCFIVGITSTVDNAYIKYIIGGTVIVHIYLKICIYMMEKSIAKNQNKKNIGHKEKEKNENLATEEQINIDFDKTLNDENLSTEEQININFGKTLNIDKK